MRRALLVLPTIFCFLCDARSWAGGDDVKPCDKMQTSYTLLKLNDLYETTRAYYADSSESLNPGSIVGDFDGDGRDDCAMLLVAKDTNGDMLLSITISRKQQEDQVYLKSIGPYSYKGILFISPVILDIELLAVESGRQIDSLKLAQNGIKLTYYGKAETQFFWSDKNQEIMLFPTGE